ncbi:MAG TPA: hypothetical protein VK466_07830, partial [Terriglobales bacterium]|nr:hypothetical protein [Terriglobales bacterium]
MTWRFRQAHKLTAKDTIVLADFVNSTGDPVFDDALKLGLRVQLEQSPFLNILSDEVNKTLQLMGRSRGERLTTDLAHELCQRIRSKAVLTGSIATFGAQYVIGLSATNCATGALLVTEQIQAARKEDVLKGLDKITRQLRRKLGGESLASVQWFDIPLEQATTPSLEALKAWSMAIAIFSEKGCAAAIPLLTRAIELDPNFAAAHATLGTAYMNIQQPGLAAESFRKAYELRGRVSEWERFYIESHYYHFATGELPKAIQV